MLLRHVADRGLGRRRPRRVDRPPVDVTSPPSRVEQAADHRDRRGLARAVRAEQAVGLARGDREADVVDGDPLVETFLQPRAAQDRLGDGASGHVAEPSRWPGPSRRPATGEKRSGGGLRRSTRGHLARYELAEPSRGGGGSGGDQPRRGREGLPRRHRAVRRLNLDIDDGEFLVLVGPVGLRQDHRPAHGRRARGHHRGDDPHRRPRRQRRSVRRTATSRWCSRTTRSIPTCRPRQHRLRPAAAQDRQGRDRRAGAQAPPRSSAWRSSSTASRATSPAASGSGSRWVGRSCASRRSFLMDEPLSNLDAKLRVQMRAEIARLQDDLGRHHHLRHPRPDRGHDPGRPGRRDEEGRPPAGRPAAGALRPARSTSSSRGFIGSPAMNLVEADARGGDDGVASRSPAPALRLLDRVLVAARPALARYLGRRSSSASAPRTWRTPRSYVDASPDRRSARASTSSRRWAPTSSSTSAVDAAAGPHRGHAGARPRRRRRATGPTRHEARDHRSSPASAPAPRRRCAGTIELVVDTDAAAPLRPRHGARDPRRSAGDERHERRNGMRTGGHDAAAPARDRRGSLLFGAGVRRRRGPAATGDGPATAPAAGADLRGRPSRWRPSWTGAEQERVPAGARRLRRADRRRGAASPPPATTSPPSSAPGSRAATRPTSRCCRSPACCRLRRAGRPQVAIEDVAGDRVDENYAPSGRSSAPSTASSTACGSRRPTSRRLVQHVPSSRTPAWSRRRLGRVASRSPDDRPTSACAPLSIGADDGWVLTDWFENVYLRTAGPEMYDQLAEHEIPWTDHVGEGRADRLGELWGEPDLIAGGTRTPCRPTSTDRSRRSFSDPPQGRDGLRGRLRRRRDHRRDQAEVGTDADFFPFPAIDGSEPAVVGGGDVAVPAQRHRGGKALIEFLATPEAAEVWAAEGGFISPNTQRRSCRRTRDDIARRSRRGAASGRGQRPVRPVRPAADRVRRHDRPGDVGDPPGLPPQPRATSTAPPRQLEKAAAQAYGE